MIKNNKTSYTIYEILLSKIGYRLLNNLLLFSNEITLNSE